ncbi:hypothetical protein MVEN_00935900 [Mycena venus]|uniref:Uncharacterized protein n=1 Tax=Mycena venus TaxID=2733690 RepID=A0A8H6YCY6_9AGAR|nr:hypothetical protein MVEN_00935900 [Mycena venus]
MHQRKNYARTSFASSTSFGSSTRIFTPLQSPQTGRPGPPYSCRSHSMNSATARSPQRRGPAIYYCDCPRYCKVRKVVKRTTFYQHAPYRNPLRSLHDHESALRPFVDGDIAGADRTSPREPPPKKRRLASPVQSDSDNSDSGLAIMLQSDDPVTFVGGDSEGFGQVLPDADDYPDPGSVADPNQLDDNDDPDPIVDASVPSPRPESTTPPLSPTTLPQHLDDPPPPPPPGPNHPIYERLSSIPDVEAAQLFIKALENASLDESGLDADVIHRLRNPIQECVDVSDDKDFRLSIDTYLADTYASEATYEATRRGFLRHSPDIGMLSHHEIKKEIENMTGVVPITHDMCPDSCIAYTGHWDKLEECPKCHGPRYDPVILKNSDGQRKVPLRQFDTIPLGPVLQALWRSKEGAQHMRHRQKRTAEIRAQRNANGNVTIDKYEDVYHGQAYLDAVEQGLINDDDSVLLLSIDGAQLYAMKQSDCWIYIWVFLDLDANLRYKKKFVIPGGIFPGPLKIKVVESFLFPGLYHIAALMKEGLKIWDASTDRVFTDFPFLLFGTADAPGMAMLDGRVGHTGAYGCRLFCPVKGRHKPRAPTYFPALLKPHNYTVEGCDHGDVSGHNLPPGSPDEYRRALFKVMEAKNDAQHQKRRLETGIVKPTLFSGLSRILPVPSCFPGDNMHLILNLFDLFLNLWRGTLDCDPNDNVASWDWAVLKDKIWEAHGERVASTRPYLPGSFDRPPRNIAEKINSGYKAQECLTYFFGLGPGLLYGILPDRYYRSYCKIVRAFRLSYQHEIHREEVQECHQMFCEAYKEYEELYYQRLTSRLHFCRQSMHNLLHEAPEIVRVGPGAYHGQWPMERTIGNLGEEMKQHSNPYANLSQRGVRRAQVNALKSLIPDIEPNNELPRGSEDLGHGYILLRAKDEYPQVVHGAQGDAIRQYLEEMNDEKYPDTFQPKLRRWARLRLPNGQIVRSAWKEKQKALDKVRMARNVRFTDLDGEESYAEVQFFFQADSADGETFSLALIHPYSAPDPDLLEVSSKTLWVCDGLDEDTPMEVIEVDSISSVVGMVPFDEGRVFVVHKMGLEVTGMAGTEEIDTEN